MKPSMQTKLEHYLELLNVIKSKATDEATAVTILGEIAKDERVDQMREEREIRNGEPATRRQLEYLKALGVQVKPGLTKREASMLIDEAIEKESE